MPLETDTTTLNPEESFSGDHIDSTQTTQEVVIDLNEFDFAPSWAKKLASQKKSIQDTGRRHDDSINSGAGTSIDIPHFKHKSHTSRRSENREIAKSRDTRLPLQQHNKRELKSTHAHASWLRIDFVPEPSGTESLARQIRIKCRAYPVYELAKIILQKPERYKVRVSVHQASQETNTPSKRRGHFASENQKNPPSQRPASQIYHCLIDDTIWLSQESAISHIFKNHFEKFYQTHTESIDPPKGNFTHMALCGITGTPIAPPNHHGYQAAIRETYRAKSIRMPFDAYKAKIKIVKDEALLQEWIKQASQKTSYTPRSQPLHHTADNTQTAPDPSQEKTHQAADEPAALPSQHTSQPQSETDNTTTSTQETQLPQQTSSASSVAIETTTEDHHIIQNPSDSFSQTHPDPSPATLGSTTQNQDLKLYSLAQVKDHFLQNYAPRYLKSISAFTSHSESSLLHSEPSIVQAVKNSLEAEQNFPHSVGRNLIRQLRRLGFFFFKVPPNVLYVIPVAPNPIAADEGSLKDNIKSILRHIQLNPRCNRRHLLDTLVPDFKQDTATKLDDAAEAAQHGETLSKQEQTTQQKTAAQAALAILKDLHLLIRQGHIVEYASGELELPDPQKLINISFQTQLHKAPAQNARKRRTLRKKNSHNTSTDLPNKHTITQTTENANLPQNPNPSVISPQETPEETNSVTPENNTSADSPTAPQSVDQTKINTPDYHPEPKKSSAIPSPSFQNTSQEAT